MDDDHKRIKEELSVVEMFVAIWALGNAAVAVLFFAWFIR